jgi:hypothetical protein
MAHESGTRKRDHENEEHENKDTKKEHENDEHE